MIPYSRQLIGSSEVKAVVKTLKSNFLTQGSNLQKFENTLSKNLAQNILLVLTAPQAHCISLVWL